MAVYSDNLFQSPKNDNYIHSANCDNLLYTVISASVCVRSLSEAYPSLKTAYIQYDCNTYFMVEGVRV